MYVRSLMKQNNLSIKKIKEKRFSLLLKKLKKKEIKENKIISERGNLFCLRKLEVCC